MSSFIQKHFMSFKHIKFCKISKDKQVTAMES
jgi:hypothetical protein